MKVFISHSSRDKWVARRISQDLNAMGIETFLDEKDIETGASIDEVIGDHLKDCDDCLMLLSPSALNSHWVLIEIGGAKALGKRLIPVLLHVGANEIPAPLSKHLARDINEIDKYYDEVRKRLAGEKVPERKPGISKRPVASRKRLKSFKVADKVRIASSPQSDIQRGNEVVIDWVAEMNGYLGATAVVTEADSDQSVRLDIDDGEYWWAVEWLTKL